MKVSSVAQMRAMDHAAIEEYGIHEGLLMENAGAAAFRALAARLPIDSHAEEQARGLIVCGGGNNGGDGFVVARHIHSAGGAVQVLVLSDPDKYGEAARVNYDSLVRLGLPMQHGFDAETATRALKWADFVVDGLFGTGLTRQVEGDYAALIRQINEAGKPVLSLDIPSGVQGDTGAVMGEAVQARWTVTFGLPKPGNLLFPGAGLGGELLVTHISFPPRLYNDENLTIETNEPLHLPPRAADGHKSSFGQALVVAGAASYYGAPYFSALSFMRAGGGYVRLATPASLAPYLAVGGREIVFLPQSESADGAIEADNANDLIEMANRMDFVIVGPGLSLAQDAQTLTRALVENVEMPLLLDGDGLTALVEHTGLLAARTGATILTPHLGEMARLTGLTVAEIEGDRITALRRACAEWQSMIVLKGAHSLVGLPDGRVYVNLNGNSGMGSAGSGDVLTGTIGALVGLGLAVEDAARMGVFVHALAGDLAADEKGMDGMTAQDILDALPLAMMKARRPEVIARYDVPVIDSGWGMA